MFIDDNHDYELALFDIPCATRMMNPGAHHIARMIDEIRSLLLPPHISGRSRCRRPACRSRSRIQQVAATEAAQHVRLVSGGDGRSKPEDVAVKSTR